MRRSFSHLLVALAGVALVACGSDAEYAAALGGPDASVDPPAPLAECVDVDGDGYGEFCAPGPDCDDGDPNVTDGCVRCATPDEGCPCSNEGTTIACGKIATKTETHVTCTMGERICSGGAWSACAPSEIFSTKPVPTKGLGGVSGCVGNPCDPYCKSFPDTPDGTLSNDAGIVGTDSGLTVIPEPIDAGPPVTCADLSLEAEKVPLDMVVMYDRSGSMSGTRWTSARDAMRAYVILPETAGDGMALNYFPESSGSQACQVSRYSGYDVPMGTLPGGNSGHAVTIRNSLNATSPTGANTPTLPAMQGAVAYAQAWQAAHPTRRTVIILATDGEPNGCSSNVTNTANAVKVAYDGSPSIPTYVIGVGSSLSNLNSIAAAGSGGKESYIPVASGDTTAFVNAMRKIRSKAAGCDFVLPTPPSGDISPGGTVVQIKDTSSGTTQTLPQRTSAAACGTSAGFYYDNPSDPKKAFLCPSSCMKVGSDVDYKVEIVFKCKATCGKGAFKAEPQPVGMYIMLDKSGSMGGSRWTNVTNALKTFINASSSAGLGVGIDYYPSGSNTCTLTNYSTPSVPIGLLPGNASALTSSINGTSPSGGTPTSAALEGAINYARSYQVANPTHKSVVVLATDGEPNGCNNSITYIGDTVAKGHGVDKTPSINTYVIGVGSGVSTTNMNYIASRGGSGAAYMVNDGSPTAFLTAIDDIRKRTLSCDFAVPPTALGIIDGNTLKLRYVRDDGTVVNVSRVSGASACGSAGTGVGWYSDAILNPTKINLCGGTCTDVKAQDKAELYVFYDCLEGGEGTFTRDYQIDCPVGTRPVWGYWSWNATTPGTSSIDFTVTSGSTIGELNTNPEVPLRFTNPPGPASLVGQPIGVKSTPVNTQVGFTFVDSSLALGGLSRNTKMVRIRAHLKGTTVQPTLTKWNQEVSCIPAE